LSDPPAKTHPNNDDAGPEINALRDAVVAAMGELAAASKELAVLFAGIDLGMQTGIGAIRGGMRAADLAGSMNLPGRREALNEVAVRARTAQHAMLRSLFRLAAAEGSPKAEIARTWRVSRQLVSRMIKEPG
jgi:hypothetical protein